MCVDTYHMYDHADHSSIFMIPFPLHIRKEEKAMGSGRSAEGKAFDSISERSRSNLVIPSELSTKVEHLRRGGFDSR